MMMKLKELILENRSRFFDQGLAITDGKLWGSVLDCIGYMACKNKEPVPVAVSVKEVEMGTRWPLTALNERELVEMAKNAEKGVAVAVLIGFRETGKIFLLPFAELKRKWDLMVWGCGPSSIKQDDTALIEVFLPDIFAPLMNNPERFMKEKYAKAV
jgi:hypothetical protein